MLDIEKDRLAARTPSTNAQIDVPTIWHPELVLGPNTLGIFGRIDVTAISTDIDCIYELKHSTDTFCSSDWIL